MARYEQAIEVYYGQILSRYFLEYDIIVGPYLMKLLQLWNINVPKFRYRNVRPSA